MNFQKLKYAVVVANSGSFREASRRLYMAQSSLSTAIKELEEEYQIQIFERTKRGVFITNEGSEFLSYAEDILSQVETLENRYLEDNERRLFSVSGQHYDFACAAFSQLIAEESGNGWDFRFLETSTSQVLEDVKRSYSELGLLYMNDKNQRVIEQYLNRYELVFHQLGNFYPHAFVGTKHPLADRDQVSLEELSQYPVIKFEQSWGSSMQFTEESLEPDFEGQEVVYASDRATVINVLANTQAYLIGSGLVTSPFADLERIIPIEGQDNKPNKIGYIEARYRKTSPFAKRYITLLENMVNSWYSDLSEWLVRTYFTCRDEWTRKRGIIMAYEIKKDGNAFIIEGEDGQRIGEITWSPADQFVIADHTWTHPSLRGKGVAGQLLDHLVDYMEQEDKYILASCPYVVEKFKRQPQKYDFINYHKQGQDKD